MSNEFDFSGYEDIINQNFYKDDFAHLSEPAKKEFPLEDELFNDLDSSTDSESFDFL